MTAATKVLTAHVPLPLADKVDQMAARLERSRGWIMKQALSAWIAQEEERDRLTQEALADVDAGRIIDHRRSGMGRKPGYGSTAAGAALMALQWTSKALSDLTRLYEFLASVNPPAASRVVQALTKAPASLLTNPRIGEQLFHPNPERSGGSWSASTKSVTKSRARSSTYCAWHTREDR